MPRKKNNKNAKNRPATRKSGLRKRRRFYRAIPYALRSGPVRLGPGSNLKIVNVKKPIPKNTTLRVSIANALMINDEFSNTSQNFKFFKVLEIRVVFFQNNANVQNLIYVNLNWQNNQESPSMLIQDDSSKYVPFYRTRSRVLRYLPPRLTMQYLGDADPENRWINPAEWQPVDLVVTKYPGNLFIYNPDTIYDDMCMLEFVVAFRGNDYFDGLSLKIFPSSQGTVAISNDKIRAMEEEAKKEKERNMIRNKLDKEFPKEEEIKDSDQAYLRRRIGYLAQRLDQLRLQLKDSLESNINDKEKKEVEKLVSKIMKKREDKKKEDDGDPPKEEDRQKLDFRFKIPKNEVLSDED